MFLNSPVRLVALAMSFGEVKIICLSLGKTWLVLNTS